MLGLLDRFLNGTLATLNIRMVWKPGDRCLINYILGAMEKGTDLFWPKYPEH